jgi:glycosyltransferase involved in cell wall biosynthesis
MKVLELCLSPGRGGMELYMVRTVQALRASHEVLPVIGAGDSLIRARLEAAGIPYRTCAPRLRELPLLAARRLARLIDREQVEVLHAHWRLDLPLAALARRCSVRRPRLVYTAQMKMSHRKMDPYHDFIYGQVDTLLTITAQLRDQIRARLRPHLRERVRLLYYGTAPPRLLDEARREALRESLGLPPGAFVVGLFGQKFEGKGQHLLVEALGRLKDGGMPARALLVGPVVDAGYVARVQARCAELGLAGAVVWKDFVDEPQALMQVCDCVVLATYQETFGLVLIEAMSAGVPVIGSDAGGVPEIIDPERTGLLFRTRSAAHLAEALASLYRHPERRAALALAGQQKAREVFGLADHYRKLEAVLRGETSEG